MKNRSDIAYAWAAGFFDGEGHVGFYLEGGKKRRIQVNIAQVNKEHLRRFLDVVEVGNINGPYNYKNEFKGQPWFMYRATGPKVQQVFDKIGPFLSREKAEKFQEALENYSSALRQD